MKAFQKQVEAHLSQAFTGLVVSTLPALSTPGDWVSSMAICSTTPRATVAIMFVVLGLLTSGA